MSRYLLYAHQQTLANSLRSGTGFLRNTQQPKMAKKRHQSKEQTHTIKIFTLTIPQNDPKTC